MKKTAAEWFRKSAEGGDADGMYQYARMLEKGEGIKKAFHR